MNVSYDSLPSEIRKLPTLAVVAYATITDPEGFDPTNFFSLYLQWEDRQAMMERLFQAASIVWNIFPAVLEDSMTEAIGSNDPTVGFHFCKNNYSDFANQYFVGKRAKDGKWQSDYDDDLRAMLYCIQAAINMRMFSVSLCADTIIESVHRLHDLSQYR